MKFTEKEENDVVKKELVLEKRDLPLTIVYKDKKYTLLITKNDKMLLNKKSFNQPVSQPSGSISESASQRADRFVTTIGRESFGFLFA